MTTTTKYQLQGRWRMEDISQDPPRNVLRAHYRRTRSRTAQPVRVPVEGEIWPHMSDGSAKIVRVFNRDVAYIVTRIDGEQKLLAASLEGFHQVFNPPKPTAYEIILQGTIGIFPNSKAEADCIYETLKKNGYLQ